MSAPLSVPPRCWSPSAGRLTVAGGSWRPLFACCLPRPCLPRCVALLSFCGRGAGGGGGYAPIQKAGAKRPLEEGGELSV